MPFADKVIHVTLSGSMLGGSEEWQTGFYLGQAAGAAQVPTQAYADVVRDAWKTWFTINGMVHQSYTFTQVKLARLGTDGKYDGSDVVVSTPATAVVGAYGGSLMPPQIALVATLIAGSGKGLAGKGRMYLPGISAGLAANGHLDQTFCGTVATSLATFFNTINSSFEAPGRAINASKGHEKLLGVGARNVPINGVRVGNVYDTQRRRRNALAETYSTAVVAD